MGHHRDDPYLLLLNHFKNTCLTKHYGIITTMYELRKGTQKKSFSKINTLFFSATSA